MDNFEIEKDCLDIVRLILPKDTGNLAFNATKSRALTDGFIIYVDERIADYTKYVFARKDYWKTAYNAVAGYIAGKSNSDFTNMNYVKEKLGELSPDNPARQRTMINSLSRTIGEV